MINRACDHLSHLWLRPAAPRCSVPRCSAFMIRTKGKDADALYQTDEVLSGQDQKPCLTLAPPPHSGGRCLDQRVNRGGRDDAAQHEASFGEERTELAL